MASNKSSFYSRDTGLNDNPAGVGEKKPYNGAERRRENRRKNEDRREEVRFDLKKTDRRQSDGRREVDKAPKFW